MTPQPDEAASDVRNGNKNTVPPKNVALEEANAGSS